MADLYVGYMEKICRNLRVSFSCMHNLMKLIYSSYLIVYLWILDKSRVCGKLIG